MTRGCPLLTSRGLHTWTARRSLWPFTQLWAAEPVCLSEGPRSTLGVLLWCSIGEGRGDGMSSPLPPSSSPLEKWGLQDWGSLNVSCDSTSTLFLLFLLWLVGEMCFGAKEGCLANAFGMNEDCPPTSTPPNWGVPQAAFLRMLVTIVFIFVSV